MGNFGGNGDIHINEQYHFESWFRRLHDPRKEAWKLDFG